MASDTILPSIRSRRIAGKGRGLRQVGRSSCRPIATVTEKLEALQERIDRIESAPIALPSSSAWDHAIIRFNKYCSGFCCMHAIKEAIIAREHDKEAEVYIFGMDIRAVGKGFEEYRNRGAHEAGIQLHPQPCGGNHRRQGSHAHHLVRRHQRAPAFTSLPVDLVILATACEPSAAWSGWPELLGITIERVWVFQDGLLSASWIPPGRASLSAAVRTVPWIFRNRLLRPAALPLEAAQVLSGSETERLAS